MHYHINHQADSRSVKGNRCRRAVWISVRRVSTTIAVARLAGRVGGDWGGVCAGAFGFGGVGLEEIEALLDLPMKVLSGCFDRLSEPSTWFTSLTAFLSRQRVGANTRMSSMKRT